MSNSGINFKVYCSSGASSEVKRFFVDSGAVTSFIFMKEKLKSVFPILRDGDFRITWKDSDSDMISITNDDDFITALTEMSETPKVLYVNAESKVAPEESRRHFQTYCDICQKGISGYRYKCIECPDFDLCATCEGNGHHSEHMVLRLVNSNIPFAKLDRKILHNAARALKKSAFSFAKDAHRCARDSFRHADKEKCSRNETAATSGENSAHECPFAAADVGEIINQNINPLIEMFVKQTQNVPNQQDAATNPLSELLRSVVEAFSTSVTTDEPTAQPAQDSDSTNAQKPAETENKENRQNTQDQRNQTSTQPSAPVAPSTNPNTQEMEWTIVNDSEESSSQASASSQTPTAQPPTPPQDPRLMRGLAQLYEMGFSNENQFLNYMLEAHNYNVGDVVKAILEMK